jgi:hypothetical protein
MPVVATEQQNIRASYICKLSNSSQHIYVALKHRCHQAPREELNVAATRTADDEVGKYSFSKKQGTLQQATPCHTCGKASSEQQYQLPSCTSCWIPPIESTAYFCSKSPLAEGNPTAGAAAWRKLSAQEYAAV